MLLIAKFLAGLFSALNGEVSPKQIAAGFALGALIGLLPLGLMPTLFLLFSFLVNVNLPMVGAATLLFKLLAFLVDPLANQLGFFFLTKVPDLQPFWTKLYNMPLIPYTRFNNTIVLGSLLIGMALLIPLYFMGVWGVNAYRTRWRNQVLKLRIVQVVKASTFYKYYLAYKGIRGE